MNFIDAYYDKETGISKVIMQHLGRRFLGKAQCHPEEEKPSEFAGCSYAEKRATIKALKYERKLAKIKSDMAIDFMKSCEAYKDFDKESPTAKVLYKQLNKRIKKVNDLADEINNLMKELDQEMQRRDIVTRALDRHRAKQDNES